MNGKRKGLEWCRRAAEIYVGLLLTVFVLVCAPYGRISQTKYTLFLVLCGGFALLLTVLILELLALQQLTWGDLRPLFRENRVPLLLLAAFLLCNVLSALGSPYDYPRWLGMSRREGLLTQGIYGATFALLLLFGRLRPWHLHAWGITMTLFCALCLVQLTGANPFGLYPAGYNFYDAYRAYPGEYLGTLGNADLTAALLAMSALGFAAWLAVGEGRDRLWLALPLGLCVLTLLWAGVAAGLVALVLGLALLLPLALHCRGSRAWKPMLLGELGAGLAALVLLYCWTPPGGTLLELHDLLHGQLAGSFGSGRIHIWRQVLRAMPEHLLLGTGPDTMAAWDLEGFSRYNEALGQVVTAGIDVAHNEFLNLAAQQGLLTLLAYLGLLLTVLWRFCRRRNRRAVLVPAMAAAAYLIQSCFSFSMCITAPLFWAMAGLAATREEYQP